MSHALFGRRFVGMRTPAWHQLGTVIPAGTAIGVEEALRLGGLDFTYAMLPIGYATPDGAFVQSGEKQVILRSPTPDDPQWRELGVVGPDYAFLQNEELARGLDAIAQATGWRFETLGALNLGGTVFLTLKTGQHSIFGDAYETYLIVSDGKAQQRALSITVSPVRVVCANTLIGADAAAITSVRIAHDQAVAGEYRFWLGLIEQLERAQDAAYGDLEAMAQVKITEDIAQRIINAALPLPATTAKMAQGEGLLRLSSLTETQRALILARAGASEQRHEEARRQQQRRRSSAMALYRRFNAGQEQGALGGRVVEARTLQTLRETPYAALQAVAELVDHAGRANAQVAAGSALFGAGAETKQRAWRAALWAVARDGDGPGEVPPASVLAGSDGAP